MDTRNLANFSSRSNFNPAFAGVFRHAPLAGGGGGGVKLPHLIIPEERVAAHRRRRRSKALDETHLINA